MSGASGNERMSYWIDTVPADQIMAPRLDVDERADVAVIGGGIAGLTTAYLLAKAGKDVVLLDKAPFAMAETGHTTAHLQIVCDTRLADLVPAFGLDGARKVWDSQMEAVRLIEQIAQDEGIACDLERLDAFLYTDRDDERKLLQEELRLTKRIGYEAEWAEPDDVPFPAKHVLRFPHQGKFHVRKYLRGLAVAARKRGARLYADTEVSEVKEGRKARVETRGGPDVRARHVVHATNVPLWGNELFHVRVEPYRTYVIGARVPKGVFDDALYWDTRDPYHYARVEPAGEGADLVILGGEDHAVGDEEATDLHWGKLYEHLRKATDRFTPVYQWSGEIFETDDDLPYIGRAWGRRKNEWVIAGDSGTGMTNGTIGALMVSERILGRGTPWDELYDSTRPADTDRGALSTVAHKALRDTQRLGRLAWKRSEIDDVAELVPGQGAILKQGLKPVAVARLENGDLRALSAICTHAGCMVKWNHGEGSWDCQCHGSRFSPEGAVLHGPANKALPEVDLNGILERRGEKAHEQ
ncbi:MAG: hypothetical protein QOE90_996 [Thermoplasmata archaeon]|jgi:glycine/D-amino acid oxidase-like deaminating enzyme/nitrite reductase/ring-hydroxylating ferredoxin subunit|nr:hypothetical protein [Thermoplasmata archaeon]